MNDLGQQDAEIITGEELEKIPLHFIIPTGLTSRYAHHMIVQASDLEVTLSFFEAKPPLVVGGIEAQKEALKGGVTAECVARVIIAKARFPDFMRALRDVPIEQGK